jgi:hypothetical protein
MPLLRTALALMAAAWLIGHDYHVNPQGDDAGPGSAARPWRTLDRASAAVLRPGDRLVLAAGATFTGTLHLTADDGGTADQPIDIGPPPGGRARIVAHAASAIVISNTGGIVVRDLDLVGDDATAVTRHHGCWAYTDAADGRRLPPLAFQRLDITGFGDAGLSVGSWHASAPGWDGIRITAIRSHGNHGAGISTWDDPAAPGAPSLRDVQIRDCRADGNRSGSGIVLAGIAGGVVEQCTAIGNRGSDGGVGIWAYDCHRLAIRDCLAADTRTNGKDGGGFDLDGGCRDCIIERCWSTGNDGPGFMHCDYPAAKATRGNRIRMCVSIDDGRNGRGGIGFGFVTWGSGLFGCAIEHCVAVATDPGGTPNPLLMTNHLVGWEATGDRPRLEGCTFRGVVAIIAGGRGGLLVRDEVAGAGIVFAGNHFAAPPGQRRFQVGDRATGAIYDGLAAWRAASGHEAAGGSEGEAGLILPDAAAALPRDAAHLADLAWFRRSPEARLPRVPRADLLDGGAATDWWGRPVPDPSWAGIDQGP